MHNISRVIIVFSILCFSNQSTAGGPITVQGPDGHTPVNYQNPNITMHVENGDLGAMSNAVTVALMQDAFDLWSNVTTSSVNLVINQTQLNFDIFIDNFDTYLPDVNNSNLHTDDNLNPIVYDSNGEIIDEYFGLGQSDFVIGFAASVFATNSSHFIEGYTVINGKDFGLTNTQLKIIFAHEIAHFFGLDHSQNNINNRESFFDLPLFCLSTNSENYPLMYPVSCRNSDSLHADDISAVSALYPAANINDSFGILQGHFLDESGNAILGANIWAENTTTGVIVSVVSDYLKQGTGYFKLYLPPGKYTLHANSINTEFTAGSGVGPYSITSSDTSFRSPHPIAEVTFHGSSETNNEVIAITTRQTVTIDFANTGALIITEPNNDPDNKSDDDDSLSDLFGATSHITLIIMFGLLVCARSLTKP